MQDIIPLFVRIGFKIVLEDAHRVIFSSSDQRSFILTDTLSDTDFTTLSNDSTYFGLIIFSKSPFCLKFYANATPKSKYFSPILQKFTLFWTPSNSTRFGINPAYADMEKENIKWAQTQTLKRLNQLDGTSFSYFALFMHEEITSRFGSAFQTLCDLLRTEIRDPSESDLDDQSIYRFILGWMFWIFYHSLEQSAMLSKFRVEFQSNVLKSPATSFYNSILKLAFKQSQCPFADGKNSTSELCLSNQGCDQLLAFLSSWNWYFRCENSPQDMLAITPSDVIESVVVTIGSPKEKGTVYTPRLLAEYQVQAIFWFYFRDLKALSLVQLFTRPEGIDLNINSQEVLDCFFNTFEDIKILDPTVGSGIFLGTVLDFVDPIYFHVVLFLLHANLQNSLHSPPFDQFAADLIAYTNAFFHNSESWTMNSLVESQKGRDLIHTFCRHRILSKNLFGIDIDQVAILFCRWYLWCEEMAYMPFETHTTHEKALNLFSPLLFTIQCGNSLIGITNEAEMVSIQNKLLQKIKTQEQKGKPPRSALTDVILSHRLFSEETRHQSLALMTDYYQQYMNHVIRGELEIASKLEHNLQGLIQEWSVYCSSLLVAQIDRKMLGENEVSKAHPFHWIAQLPDWTSPQFQGFDLVIGNLPFIRPEIQYDALNLQRQILTRIPTRLNAHTLQVFSCDLSALFYARALLHWLKTGGYMSVFVTDAFGTISSHLVLLYKLVQSNTVLQLDFFDYNDVFPGCNVIPMQLIIRNQAAGPNHQISKTVHFKTPGDSKEILVSQQQYALGFDKKLLLKLFCKPILKSVKVKR